MSRDQVMAEIVYWRSVARRYQLLFRWFLAGLIAVLVLVLLSVFLDWLTVAGVLLLAALGCVVGLLRSLRERRVATAFERSEESRLDMSIGEVDAV